MGISDAMVDAFLSHVVLVFYEAGEGLRVPLATRVREKYPAASDAAIEAAQARIYQIATFIYNVLEEANGRLDADRLLERLVIQFPTVSRDALRAVATRTMHVWHM